jgi:hypothetical protein
LTNIQTNIGFSETTRAGEAEMFRKKLISLSIITTNIPMQQDHGIYGAEKKKILMDLW